jgi:hypothetical protein
MRIDGRKESKEAEKELGIGAWIAGLLYTQEGVKWGVEVWKGFARKSRERMHKKAEEESEAGNRERVGGTGARMKDRVFFL